ncbi:MAG: nitrogenase component 1 [Methanofollis sp.]|uniref:nitrogenase component 1 n=1 Tax=Methanofollis sp. TaxID=2052835 RepID=UPI00261B55E2|nr:nitrogenase component 1 [Methanofollis sp.]MDD4255083.1 nitrogenase component 1 [Methanofollis sp.]
MPERLCSNPVWPCAMCGAASCLSGFSGLDVVIHGSSGCYFYPASLLQTPIHATLIMEEEVIFGAEERLRRVVGEIAGNGRPVAVVQSCVPAVMGEDIGKALEGMEAFVVDSPGFAGGMEEGYRRAVAALAPAVDPGETGITIDGLNPIDPFWRGNLLEAERLVGAAGGTVAATIAAGPLDSLRRCGSTVLQTNPGLASGIGTPVGSLLGIPATKAAFESLADLRGLDVGAVLDEADTAEERIGRASDKFLSRSDPPTVAVFGEAAYTAFVSDALVHYLDAEVVVNAPRNGEGAVTSLDAIRDMILETEPGLILGSSFEHAVAPDVPYVGITFPQRGRVRLRARTLAGIEGSLSLMDDVLNACMERKGS